MAVAKGLQTFPCPGSLSKTRPKLLSAIGRSFSMRLSVPLNQGGTAPANANQALPISFSSNMLMAAFSTQMDYDGWINAGNWYFARSKTNINRGKNADSACYYIAFGR